MAIPAQIKKQLEGLDRMQKCENCNTKNNIQWHHALIYSGKQMQEPYAIRALCRNCHMGNSMKPKKKAELKSKIYAIQEGLADNIQTKYNKRDWKQQLKKHRNQLKQLDENLRAKLNGYI